MRQHDKSTDAFSFNKSDFTQHEGFPEEKHRFLRATFGRKKISQNKYLRVITRFQIRLFGSCSE